MMDVWSGRAGTKVLDWCSVPKRKPQGVDEVWQQQWILFVIKQGNDFASLGPVTVWSRKRKTLNLCWKRHVCSSSLWVPSLWRTYNSHVLMAPLGVADDSGQPCTLSRPLCSRSLALKIPFLILLGYWCIELEHGGSAAEAEPLLPEICNLRMITDVSWATLQWRAMRLLTQVHTQPSDGLCESWTTTHHPREARTPFHVSMFPTVPDHFFSIWWMYRQVYPWQPLRVIICFLSVLLIDCLKQCIVPCTSRLLLCCTLKILIFLPIYFLNNSFVFAIFVLMSSIMLRAWGIGHSCCRLPFRYN